MAYRMYSYVIENTPDNLGNLTDVEGSINLYGSAKVGGVNMEEFPKLEEGVKEYKAHHSRRSVPTNYYKECTNEKVRELIYRNVSIKAIQSKVLKL